MFASTLFFPNSSETQIGAMRFLVLVLISQSPALLLVRPRYCTSAAILQLSFATLTVQRPVFSGHRWFLGFPRAIAVNFHSFTAILTPAVCTATTFA